MAIMNTIYSKIKWNAILINFSKRVFMGDIKKSIFTLHRVKPSLEFVELFSYLLH